MLDSIKITIKKILPKKVTKFIQQFLAFLKNPKYFIQTIFIFKNTSIVRVNNFINYEIILDPKNGFVDKQVFVYKDFEPEIKEIFLKYVNEGFTVLDIGANIGVHTLFFSKIVGDSGKVIAFEPIKKIYEQLKKSIAINDFKNIDLNNFALGNKEEEVEINIVRENIGASSIYDNVDSNKKENISVKILDNLNLPKIDFIKIDVEGYEWNVIKGSKKLIEKDKPNIIFEYNPDSYDKKEQNSSLQLLEYLKSLEYKLFDVSEINKEIDDFITYRKSFHPLLKAQSNILALYTKV